MQLTFTRPDTPCTRPRPPGARTCGLHSPLSTQHARGLLPSARRFIWAIMSWLPRQSKSPVCYLLISSATAAQGEDDPRSDGRCFGFCAAGHVSLDAEAGLLHLSGAASLQDHQCRRLCAPRWSLLLRVLPGGGVRRVARVHKKYPGGTCFLQTPQPRAVQPTSRRLAASAALSPHRPFRRRPRPRLRRVAP